MAALPAMSASFAILFVIFHFSSLEAFGVGFGTTSTVRMPKAKTFPATSTTAASLVRSRITFRKIARSVAGLSLPSIDGIEYGLNFSGKIEFEGYLSTSIEREVNSIVNISSKSFLRRLRGEQSHLKSVAGKNYFWFFQAAVNYGFRNKKWVKKLVKDREFKDLSFKLSHFFNKTNPYRLEARFNISFKGVSNGVGGTTRLFGYIPVNEVTFKSGHTVLIAKPISDLVVANGRGDILGKETYTAVVAAAKADVDVVVDSTPEQ